MAVVPTAPGRLPVLGHTLSLIRDRTKFMGSLRRWGDIVRIFLGPMPAYVISNADLARQVLVTEAGDYERGMFYNRMRPYLGNGLATTSGTQHLRARRLLQPAFHRREITGYVDGMRRLATEFVGTWRPGEIRNIDNDMQVLSGHLVGDALFSASLGTDELADIVASVDLLIKLSTTRAMSPKVVQRLPLPVNRRFDEATAHVRKVVADVVAARRASQQEHHDLLHMLLTARHEDTGARLTDTEIHDQVVAFLVAGIETTGRMLAWFFYELSRRPDIRDRVMAELTEVLDGAPVGVEHLPKLTYVRQVADEVLRHYAALLLMRRTVTNVDLGGVSVPADHEVIVSPHAMHHDPRYFANPGFFDPDRWAPDRVGELTRHAYMPFSTGAYQCIGSTFAHTEMAVVVAAILSRVQLTQAPGKPMRAKMTILPVPSGLRMVVTPN